MKKTATLQKVLRFLKPYWALTVLTILLAIGSVLLTLYVPVLVGDAIDYIVDAGNVHFGEIAPLLLTAAICIGITALLQWLMSLINNHITIRVVRDIRQKAFSRLQILPLSYLDRNRSGEIVSRIITDVDTFSEGLLLGFTQLFTGVVTILGTLVFMFALNPLVALLVVVLTPLSLFVAQFIAKRTYHLFQKQSACRGEQTAFIDEVIANQKVVQAFSHEDESLAQFDVLNDNLEKASVSAIFFSSLVNPSTRFVNSVVYAAVALTGALNILAGGGLTVGMLSVLLSYANQYTKPFNEISGVVTELQNAIACAARVLEFIDETPETPDPANAIVPTTVDGNMTLENVRFSYDKQKRLIEDFSLAVKPGQRVALVGPTGCGKTTVINLLMRFYEVDGGRILVDGVDMRDYNRKALRRQFGMVLQETWLMSGTVRDNIRMGRPDASDEEVVAAAKAAHAHGFIRRLKDGYDTVIGEDGGSLSQGQKQLLCIARVMLTLPPMLILDEATSSIDTRTEAKIQSAFLNMMQGRTCFIVAHRLSTIREADIILVMRDGAIVEQGTHDALLTQNGFYATLYHSQFEE